MSRNIFCLKSLKEQCPGGNILLDNSSVCENWCCHTRSQYDKLFSRYKEKTVSTTINATTTQTFCWICI